jgi:MSHA pilin protein MshC
MKSNGFTLTELVVMLLVIGILAAVIIPTMNMNVFQERTEYDSVFSAIQYARKSAIAKRRYVCVAVSSSAVSLTLDPNPPEATATPFAGTCPFSTALALPAPDKNCAPNQSCLKATSLTSTAAAFQFDALGRAAATVTVTVTGFPAITVEAETGHVH